MEEIINGIILLNAKINDMILYVQSIGEILIKKDLEINALQELVLIQENRIKKLEERERNVINWN